MAKAKKATKKTKTDGKTREQLLNENAKLKAALKAIEGLLEKKEAEVKRLTLDPHYIRTNSP